MYRLTAVLAIAATLTLAGCGQKEEPKPQELPPPPATPAPAPVDTTPKLDTVKPVEEPKKPAPAKKKTETVQTNADGSASGGQIRASRDEKKEGEASGGQIRKSR
jgi:outer membrane biosynthesis protein TonB